MDNGMTTEQANQLKSIYDRMNNSEIDELNVDSTYAVANGRANCALEFNNIVKKYVYVHIKGTISYYQIRALDSNNNILGVIETQSISTQSFILNKKFNILDLYPNAKIIYAEVHVSNQYGITVLMSF